VTADLDRIDRAILEALAGNARISITDLAAAVGLSKSPCAARLRRLEDSGIIRGYRPVLDHARLGQGHIAFVQVHLSNTRSPALAAFEAAIKVIPEVEECHLIAGAFDYLVKVRTRDISAFREVLGEKISALPHVSHTSTFVAMGTVVDLGD
jgi:Lrp/AsnC family transcriptional regulator, leucine-responsive regulatory protein